MRLKLTLRPQNCPARIPINYQYPVSAAIYKILLKASPAYAQFLHGKGYIAPSGRFMKLFTFSKLWIPGVQRDGSVLIGGKRPWFLQIGSPMEEEFVRNFLVGLFESCQIVIGNRRTRTVLNILQVESLEMPSFEPVMRFQCLSPLVASTAWRRNGKLERYYFRPYDPELSEAFRNNLLEKGQIIYGKLPEENRLLFRLESEDKPRSKLITIKEGTPEETQVKAFETHFTLEGSPELMRVAWDCGLGEKGSMGFGMVGVVSSDK